MHGRQYAQDDGQNQHQQYQQRGEPADGTTGTSVMGTDHAVGYATDRGRMDCDMTWWNMLLATHPDVIATIILFCWPAWRVCFEPDGLTHDERNHYYQRTIIVTCMLGLLSVALIFLTADQSGCQI